MHYFRKTDRHTYLSLETVEISCIEEFLHDQSQPEMGLSLPGAAFHSCGIALGRPLEVVQGGVALGVVRTLPCNDGKADRTGLLPHHPMAAHKELEEAHFKIAMVARLRYMYSPGLGRAARYLPSHSLAFLSRNCSSLPHDSSTSRCSHGFSFT